MFIPFSRLQKDKKEHRSPSGSLGGKYMQFLQKSRTLRTKRSKTPGFPHMDVRPSPTCFVKRGGLCYLLGVPTTCRLGSRAFLAATSLSPAPPSSRGSGRQKRAKRQRGPRASAIFFTQFFEQSGLQPLKAHHRVLVTHSNEVCSPRLESTSVTGPESGAHTLSG